MDADPEFIAFVRRRGDHHLRTAVLLTGDWHTAEDLVQTGLVKLYKAWPRLDTTADPDAYLGALRNYGALFLGEQATVAYGDKAVGTNHVLPTLRAARYTGGLWVGKFLKTCTYQRLTEEGTRRVAPAAAAIAGAEHMEGHALTATHRLERLAQPAR